MLILYIYIEVIHTIAVYIYTLSIRVEDKLFKSGWGMMRKRDIYLKYNGYDYSNRDFTNSRFDNMDVRIVLLVLTAVASKESHWLPFSVSFMAGGSNGASVKAQ